jgi:hypothetical protein
LSAPAGLLALVRRWLERARTLFATPGEPVESRSELSQRYMRELQELVDLGELELDAAERIRTDLFEPTGPGELPRLRLRFWQSYLRDRTGHVGPHLVGPGLGGDRRL